MRYARVREGVFLARPNRFIAEVALEGVPTVCHVKNTGRCRELLVPGAKVWLAEADNPMRRTKFDLVAVQKGDRLINMDAAAPNRAFGEFLAAGGVFERPDLVRPETVFGDSRFDFYVEAGERRAFLEVKGVTLEEDGAVLFPDAPTDRGVKHLIGLTQAVGAGFEAYAVFVVQMADVRYFTPNRRTHPAFADALLRARDAGVRVLAYDCAVTPESMAIGKPVNIVI